MIPDNYQEKRLRLKRCVDGWQTVAEREAYAGRDTLKLAHAALEEYYARLAYYRFLAQSHKEK